MDFKNVVEQRRSIRKYEDKAVPRDIIKEVVRMASFSPSWKNTQIVRYVIVDDASKKEELADKAASVYAYNAKTIKNAPGVCVITMESGISGFEEDGSYTTSKEDRWEMFDAGIATQTFALAAFEEGIGTVILGIFDEEKVKEVLNLPENEKVAAIVAFGYPAKTPAMPPRKSADELIRFVQ